MRREKKIRKIAPYKNQSNETPKKNYWSNEMLVVISIDRLFKVSGMHLKFVLWIKRRIQVSL